MSRELADFDIPLRLAVAGLIGLAIGVALALGAPAFRRFAGLGLLACAISLAVGLLIWA
jgi:hypothetical protein